MNNDTKRSSHKWLFVVLSALALIVIVFIVGSFVNTYLNDRAVNQQLSVLKLKSETPIYTNSFGKKCLKDGYGNTVCGSVGAELYEYNLQSVNKGINGLESIVKANGYTLVSGGFPGNVSQYLNTGRAGIGYPLATGNTIGDVSGRYESKDNKITLDLYCYTSQFKSQPFSQEDSPLAVDNQIYKTISQKVGDSPSTVICGYIIADGF